MELALVFKELLAHKRWVALGLLVALCLATFSIYKIQFFPPKLISRNLTVSAASTELYVDGHKSLSANLSAQPGAEVQLATVYANLMASPGGMERVGRLAGIPGDQIWSAGPIDPSEQRVVVEPTRTKREAQLVGEGFPYRVEFLTDFSLPLISIYAQAPNTTQAIRLANASVAALRAYVEKLQTREHTPVGSQVVLRSLGTATGGTVNPGIDRKLFGLVFFLAFSAWCVLVLVGVRVAAAWRRLRTIDQLEEVFAAPEVRFTPGDTPLPDTTWRIPTSE